MPESLPKATLCFHSRPSPPLVPTKEGDSVLLMPGAVSGGARPCGPSCHPPYTLLSARSSRIIDTNVLSIEQLFKVPELHDLVRCVDLHGLCILKGLRRLSTSYCLCTC